MSAVKKHHIVTVLAAFKQNNAPPTVLQNWVDDAGDDFVTDTGDFIIFNAPLLPE